MDKRWENMQRGTRNTIGFTIVELIVIIVVIVILVAITVVAYGAWRENTEASALKSDLVNAATAMEDKVNFSGTYPANISSAYTPSENTVITGGAIGSSNYCISAKRTDVSYFMTKHKVALPGTCPRVYFDPSIHQSYGGTGLGIKDLSGNGNNASFRDGLTENAFGPTFVASDAGGVLEFDGTDKYYTATPITLGQNTTWTACTKTLTSLNTYNMFMGAYLPYFGTSTNGTAVIFSNRISGTQRTITSTSPAIPLNTWNCYAFTTQYSGSNTTMKIYVNGVERSSAAFAGQQDNLNYNFTVGDGYHSAPTAAGWYPYNGRVAEVAVYPRTFTAAEVEGVFMAVRGKFGI